MTGESNVVSLRKAFAAGRDLVESPELGIRLAGERIVLIAHSTLRLIDRDYSELDTGAFGEPVGS